MSSPAPLLFEVLNRLNSLVCAVMYGVQPVNPPPLPETGPAIVVANHTSLSDPLVLLASANRRITFLMAQEIYERPLLQWVFRVFNCIPVRRGAVDVRAIRAMVRALDRGDVVGIFPEGGIDQFRDEQGHEGVAYLVVKTGAPVIPAAIWWQKPRPATLIGSLLSPCQAVVRYGAPLVFAGCSLSSDKPALSALTVQIMDAIKALQVTLHTA